MGRALLHVARSLPWQIQGGMEEHAWRLAIAWRRRGWEVEMLTTSFDDVDRVEARDGVRIHYLRHLPLNRHEVPQWRWWGRFAERAAGYALAHGAEAEVVHAESVYGHRLFRALSRRGARAARVATIHGTALQNYEDAGRSAMRLQVPAFHPRALAQRAHVAWRTHRERRHELPPAERLVAVSPRIKTRLIEDTHYPGARIDVIPNGVEVDPATPGPEEARRRLGIPRDARLILYLGRLEPSKGVHRLLDHAAAHPRDRIVIAGAGSNEALLRSQAGSLPNPGTVRFAGVVDAAQKALMIRAADVLALPSDAEGQPIVLLEALAHGTPVYATRPWIPPELEPLVAHGADVAAGIDRASELTDRVRREAPRVASEYSWDRAAQRYEDCFRRAKP